MQRLVTALLAATITFLPFLYARPANNKVTDESRNLAPSSSEQNSTLLHEKRLLPSDLEVGGELAGLPRGTARYITRDDLLGLPQIVFTVTNDTNFAGATKISGVSLDELVKRFATEPDKELAVAICDDRYRAAYPRDYMAAHHPVLVLNVNGQPPSGWPKDSMEHKFDMGPYMISNPHFVASFKILSHADEAQIPWGVVKIEFRNEQASFGAIAPQGQHAADGTVQAGFRIAQQNCFRCHNMGNEGGVKSGVSWTQLARFAQTSPKDFALYIHDPRARNPNARMPGNPEYDAATQDALTSYFKTFASGGNHSEGNK